MFGCSGSAYTTACSGSCQYPATSQPLKRSGPTLHNQQPDQLHVKEMCCTAWGKWWSHQILTGLPPPKIKVWSVYIKGGGGGANNWATTPQLYHTSLASNWGCSVRESNHWGVFWYKQSRCSDIVSYPSNFPTSAYCVCAHQYCILFLMLNNNIYCICITVRVGLGLG